MKIKLLLFLLILIKYSYSQNLVPNNSFEEINSCPISFHDFTKFLYWINPTNASPSIFNNCNQGNAGVPENINGYQNSHSGIGYAGIGIFSDPSLNNREYIQTELLSPLVTNQKYNVRVYVNLGDSSKYAINKFGIYFSQNSFFVPTFNVINYVPQISFDTLIINKIDWTLLESTYQALGGEKYITIGNFNYDSECDTILLDGPWGTFYYIDDVYVGPDSTINAVKQQLLNIKLNIFPNPTSNLINIDYEINDDFILELKNLYGITVKKTILEKNFNFKKIAINDLEGGIYCFKF